MTKAKLSDFAKLKEGIAVMKKIKKLQESEDEDIEGIESNDEEENEDLPTDTEDEVKDVEEDTPAETEVLPTQDADILSPEEIAAQIMNAEKELSDELIKSELSESVKTKIKNLLKLKEEEQVKDLENKFDSYKKEYEEEMLDKQDEYLNQVADEWLNQNKVAVESTIKSKIAEGFIEDFKALLGKYNLSLPEEEVNMIDQYKQENDELKDELNNQVSEAVKVKKALKEAKKELCIEKLAIKSNLAKSEKSKLRKLAEDVEYKDDDSFYDDLERKADSISEDDEDEVENKELENIVPAEKSVEVPSDKKDEEEPTFESALSKFLSK